MEEASSDTVPPRVRWRSSAEPKWTGDSCRRSLTRQRQSTGFACLGRTFPLSARLRSPRAVPHDVLLFVPDLLTEVRRAYPEVEGRWVADGWMPKALHAAERSGSRLGREVSPAPARTGASISASISRRWSRQRPLVGPMLPIGMLSCSAISLYGRSSSPINRPRRRSAARRQLVRRHPNGSHLLLPEEGGVKRVRLVIGDGVHQIVRGDNDLPGGDSQALAPRGGRQPRTETFRLFDPIKVFDKPQPCRLTDLRNVGIAQPAPSGDRRHQPAKAPDEGFPCRCHPLACLGHYEDQVGVVCCRCRCPLQ